MDLWIKSQDGETIIKANKISLCRKYLRCEDEKPVFFYIKVNDEVVGEYRTEKIMLEVYKEIEEIINNGNFQHKIKYTNSSGVEYVEPIKINIYEMPKE